MSDQLKSGNTLVADSATGAAISITDEIAVLAFSPSRSSSLGSSVSFDVSGLRLDLDSSSPTTVFFSAAGVVVPGAVLFFVFGSVVKPAPPRIDQ